MEEALEEWVEASRLSEESATSPQGDPMESSEIVVRSTLLQCERHFPAYAIDRPYVGDRRASVIADRGGNAKVLSPGLFTTIGRG
jgi:hypothetical protein